MRWRGRILGVAIKGHTDPQGVPFVALDDSGRRRLLARGVAFGERANAEERIRLAQVILSVGLDAADVTRLHARFADEIVAKLPDPFDLPAQAIVNWMEAER